MKCPFKRDEVMTGTRKQIVFGECDMENCMAYKVMKLSQSESACYCALMATLQVPYVFGGCYDGNN